MRTPAILAVLVLPTVLLVGATDALAQTRLAVFGGGLVPFGDLEDTTESSFRVGARMEYQPVNARGQRRLLAWFAQVAFSPLSVKAEAQEAARLAGASEDATLFGVEAGTRVYSRTAPLFLQAGAGWARFDPPGDGDAGDALDFHLGAGFLVPVDPMFLEADVTLHQGIGSDDLSFTYVAAHGGLSLPF
ncbi:MAG: hypothetical protein R3B81_12510 [bacterium]|nr:hypothetical protein [Gemmatimonadota bacterium]